MNPADVRAARETLGLSQERLAAELAVTEREVRAWEDGTARVPGRFAQLLAWQTAMQSQADALVEAGLPECEWVQAWAAEPVPARDAEQTRRLAALDAHAEQCPTCLARMRYVDEHLPPLPDPPMPAWLRLLVRFRERVERLPRWMQPAAYGAAAVGLITLARAVIAMLVVGPSLELLGMAAAGAGVGAYMGAVGGLAYHAVRDPLRRFGRAGPYLTGIVVVAAYLLALAAPVYLLTGAPVLDPGVWIIAMAVTAFFGFLLGHWWFRDAEPAAPASG
jgi:transcriptional regulator with XRE-family HTH domain